MKIKSGCIDDIGVNMAKSKGVSGDYSLLLWKVDICLKYKQPLPNYNNDDTISTYFEFRDQAIPGQQRAF